VSARKRFVLLPNRRGISQSTSLRGTTSSLALVPFFNRCGTPQSTPFGTKRPCWHTASCPSSFRAQPLHQHIASCPLPSKLSLLARISPRVHSFRGSASSLVHHPVSGSYTICNSPSPPLSDIVFFGLSLSSFLSTF